MFYNKIFCILFLFVLTNLNSKDFYIKDLCPDIPYIGTPFTIKGKGFDEPATVKLFFNDSFIEYDSLNLIEWNNREIIIILPNVKPINYIKLTNNNIDAKKIFYTKSLLDTEYFNPTKYTLKYIVNIDNIEGRNKKNGKLYLYIPQPIVSDELISKKIISLKPAPKYIQDNGILIYEINPSVTNSFRLEEVIEIITTYKKIDFNNTRDSLPYLKKSSLYKYYTQESPPSIIPNNPIIKETLNQIITKDDNTIKKIKSIYEWVIKKMHHTYPPEDRSPLYTLKTGKGDCLSDAYLFASLIRAAGIPIRLISGYIFYHNWGLGGLHFWEEVFVPGIGWISIDMSFSHSPNFLKLFKYPTQSKFYFGATDGRRMALCSGRIRLMKPDNFGNLIFYKYLDSMQVPHIATSNKDMRIKYKMNKKLIIKKITPIYDNLNDWFKNKQRIDDK